MLYMYIQLIINKSMYITDRIYARGTYAVLVVSFFFPVFVKIIFLH